MFNEKGKLQISVSDELSFSIKAYLIKIGVSSTEAESLSKSHKSIKKALKNRTFFDLPPEPKSIISTTITFPLPSLISRPKLNFQSLKSLSCDYHSAICSNSSKNSQEKKSYQDLDTYSIITYALDKGCTQEEAEKFARESQNVCETFNLIDQAKVFKPDFLLKSLGMMQPQLYGEIIKYWPGLCLNITNCTICKEDFVIGDEIRNLYCFDTFHNKCIENWFKSGKDHKCPNCNRTRQEIKNMVT